MRARRLDSLQKTLSFAVIHLLIAVSVGYALTGSFVLAGVWSLVEPAVNTLTHYRLEAAWGSDRSALGKSVAFGATHVVVAVAVGWALTGSFVLAGMFAFIEPVLNTFAHYGFERWWHHRQARRDVVLARA